jgi:hypothetical protein
VTTLPGVEVVLEIEVELLEHAYPHRRHLADRIEPVVVAGVRLVGPRVPDGAGP